MSVLAHLEEDNRRFVSVNSLGFSKHGVVLLYLTEGMINIVSKRTCIKTVS